ncbi:MAG: hypothetical protein K2X27_17880, partial [Candidatus Obscuribacterales bacterium]|nr:hypothetical protein [Candidatus Obscuribacterales bacterium]
QSQSPGFTQAQGSEASRSPLSPPDTYNQNQSQFAYGQQPHNHAQPEFAQGQLQQSARPSTYEAKPDTHLQERRYEYQQAAYHREAHISQNSSEAKMPAPAQAPFVLRSAVPGSSPGNEAQRSMQNPLHYLPPVSGKRREMSEEEKNAMKRAMGLPTDQ